MMIGHERKRLVYIEDEFADDARVICERCHKKQTTRQHQACIYCGHWWARSWQDKELTDTAQ